MFPFLLDFEPLFTEFELFVEAIDNKHELALSGHQQFPVCFISGTHYVLLLADSLLQLVKWLNPFSSREFMHYYFAREVFVQLDIA